MYIALGCFAALIIAITSCIIWRKCRSKEEKNDLANNNTKGQTER